LELLTSFTSSNAKLPYCNLHGRPVRKIETPANGSNAREDATGLRITKHDYANWIGLDCVGVSSAITTMRRLVASNILCRREDTAISLPLNPGADPQGARIARSVAELLVRDA
jgi:hypothetical protein